MEAERPPGHPSRCTRILDPGGGLYGMYHADHTFLRQVCADAHVRRFCGWTGPSRRLDEVWTACTANRVVDGCQVVSRTVVGSVLMGSRRYARFFLDNRQATVWLYLLALFTYPSNRAVMRCPSLSWTVADGCACWVRVGARFVLFARVSRIGRASRVRASTSPSPLLAADRSSRPIAYRRTGSTADACTGPVRVRCACRSAVRVR